MKTVLILGGYGNFGRRICFALSKAGIHIIINGRNKEKANQLRNAINNQYSNAKIKLAIFDVENDFSNKLQEIKPYLVINTCGPFQIKDYSIALCCIKHKIHYIDLADGRKFVTGVQSLNQKAEQAKVLVVSGASTVPALSSAIVEAYKNEFKNISSLIYGISPGQKVERGLATTESILSYLGKPLKPPPGSAQIKYGWQDLYRQSYPIIGKRWMANCDVPDIDLLPERYGIKNISFSAGVEISVLHLSLWLFSWLIRLRLPLNLFKYANFLLKASHWFDFLGTADSGMHMLIKGIGLDGKEKIIKWFIIAREGDGPQIPTIPAILLAKQLINDELNIVGAIPCIGLISLDDYLAELQSFNIQVETEK